MTRDQIFSEALTLDPASRDELAEVLWQSLSPDEFTPGQLSEIRRRMQDLDSGKVQPLPGRQVLRQLREHLRR